VTAVAAELPRHLVAAKAAHLLLGHGAAVTVPAHRNRPVAVAVAATALNGKCLCPAMTMAVAALDESSPAVTAATHCDGVTAMTMPAAALHGHRSAAVPMAPAGAVGDHRGKAATVAVTSAAAPCHHRSKAAAVAAASSASAAECRRATAVAAAAVECARAASMTAATAVRSSTAMIVAPGACKRRARYCKGCDARCEE